MTEFERGAPAPTNGLAIASLVLGIVSILIVWIPIVGFLGAIMAVVGLVLGLLALRQPEGSAMAIGGVVCAGVSLVITAIYILMFVAAIGVAANAS